MHGLGVPISHEKYFYWAKRGAELGAATAFLHLGRAYEHGYGVTANVEKSLENYARAAQLKKQRCLCLQLAQIYMYGAIDVQKSLIKAKSFLVEELATGNLEAALEVAQLQLDYPRDSFDVYNGLETLRRMADDGWLDASFNLAYFYLNFEASNASEIMPEFKPDYKEAFSHLLELMKTSYGLSNYSGLYSINGVANSQVIKERSLLMRLIKQLKIRVIFQKVLR